MAFCENCGKELVEGQACSCASAQDLNYGAGTWESMKNRMGIGDPERNATDVYERGMKIVPECISANEKEIPVKQYNIAILRNMFKFERAEGRMQVTNKRVIFRAAGRSIGGRTTLQNEFAIEEIAGVGVRRNYKFSFMYLIFAILIISSASYIVFGKSSFISSMLLPSHIQKARENERAAILQSAQAQERENQAYHNKLDAQEKEQKAISARENAEKREKENPQGYCSSYYWGPPTCDKDYFKKQKINAQENERNAIAARSRAEKDEKQATEQREIAVKKEAEATKKRESAENIWKIFMTVLGFVLGVGGLAPFFLLYKRFGLKLFILNFSIFGFALSLAASGSAIFNLFLAISIIITLACMFIFCFRPNLVISIKSKGGKGAIDVRRETQLTMYTGKGIGFSEVIPTEETESAIREIGAIIGDIQKLGDSGAERWKA